MPAVVVDDITVLPRIPEPDPAVARQRPVRSVTNAPRGFEGEGFPVRRAFAGVDLGDLDPFVHLDQMGEVEYAPGEPKGTPWHPHRGFETVTYMIDGTFEHNDSNGGGGVITNGDTQWMTAGAGILHIEKPPEALVVSGGLFHGLQLWVNLPRDQKWAAPRYQDLRAAEVALASSSDGGALVRIIAGEVAGHAGPGSTYTPMTLVHATLSPGARLALPWRVDYNALVYVLAGSGSARFPRSITLRRRSSSRARPANHGPEPPCDGAPAGVRRRHPAHEGAVHVVTAAFDLRRGGTRRVGPRTVKRGPRCRMVGPCSRRGRCHASWLPC
jgi:redox-sensitive bicupin YhaK (pirin superfamily)